MVAKSCPGAGEILQRMRHGSFDRVPVLCVLDPLGLAHPRDEWVVGFPVTHASQCPLTQHGGTVELVSVVGVVLLVTGVKVGRLEAVGPVAQVVHLLAFWYRLAGLPVADSVDEFGAFIHDERPVSVLVQAVGPHDAMTVQVVRRVDGCGYPVTVFRFDSVGLGP